MNKKQSEIIKALNVEQRLENESIQEFAQRMIQERSRFLYEYLEKTGMKGYVLGISGGVDSFVASMLANRIGKLTLISLPYGEQVDINDVKEAVEVIHPNEFIRHNIKSAVDAQIDMICYNGMPIVTPLNLLRGNIMARERMAVQYSYGLIHNCLVIGTDHATEAVTGFYTKYGDGAADVVPLVGLTKDVIYEMAKIFNAPNCIIKKAPSAGLWEGQTDEDELGLKYQDICDYLHGKEIDEKVATKIEQYYDKTEHKRHMPASISDSWWT